MAAPLIPFLADLIGVKNMLPESVQGIASLAMNPYKAVANTIAGVSSPGLYQTQNEKELANEVFRRSVADKLPGAVGDIIAPERLSDIADELKAKQILEDQEPYTFQAPAYTPSEMFKQQEFARINQLPFDEKISELNKYATGEKTWPSDVEALRIDIANSPQLEMPQPELSQILGQFNKFDLEAPQFDLSGYQFADLGLPNFEAPQFDLGNFGMQNADIPAFDYSSFDLGFARGGKVRG